MGGQEQRRNGVAQATSAADPSAPEGETKGRVSEGASVRPGTPASSHRVCQGQHARSWRDAGTRHRREGEQVMKTGCSEGIEAISSRRDGLRALAHRTEE